MAWTPEIKTLHAKKLIGIKMPMSLAHDRTGELFKGFMPRRHLIQNKSGNDIYSVKIFSADYYIKFQLENQFEKWAALEVDNDDEIPEGMEKLYIPAGLYAVFHYKGRSSEGEKIFRYIFQTWLPSSGYQLDDRPHFDLLGSKYKNGHPDSEEEIWIPIR